MILLSKSVISRKPTQCRIIMPCTIIIPVQKSLNKAGIETMNKMRVINRQTGDIFNVKVNPYLPSKAYQAIEKNNPLGYIIRRNK